MVEVVSARVDEETRNRMRRLAHVNWSEVIRVAIIEKLKEEETRRELNSVKLREAARSTDSLRRKYPKWDSTEEIRVWRERRQ